MWATYVPQEKLDVGKNTPGGYRKATGQMMISIRGSQGAMRLWKHEVDFIESDLVNDRAERGLINRIRSGRFDASDEGATALTKDLRNMAIKSIAHGHFDQLPTQYQNEFVRHEPIENGGMK
ncbi:MAG: hypothetical protein J4432_01660 [DPANN group archaeon]|nr:hypothetical protein [DPANN group archaeon]